MSSTDIFRLDGKTILITGASSGLGAHFAQVFAGAGADVILAARRTEQLEVTASKVRELGRKAYCVKLDVGQEESVQSAFDAVPLPDVAVNNAGIHVAGATHELEVSGWDRLMDTNLKGAWLVSREAIRRWIAHKRGGNIVNIASILGLRVQGQFAAYASSKAALMQLTASLALDYARYGIRANALCPGYFSTDLNRDWLVSEAGERMRLRIPYRRFGELKELNGAALLLVSDASSYMSGSTVVVDGAHSQNTL